MPITWRNVNLDVASANRLLDSSSKQIGGAFDSLGENLIGYGQHREDVRTDEAIRRILSVQDPSKVNAAAADILRNLNGRVDSDKISDVINQHRNSLNTNDKAAYERSIRDVVRQEAADLNAANIMGKYASAGASLTNAVSSRMNALTNQGRAQTYADSVRLNFLQDILGGKKSSGSSGSSNLDDYLKVTGNKSLSERMENLDEDSKAFVSNFLTGLATNEGQIDLGEGLGSYSLSPDEAWTLLEQTINSDREFFGKNFNEVDPELLRRLTKQYIGKREANK